MTLRDRIARVVACGGLCTLAVGACDARGETRGPAYGGTVVTVPGVGLSPPAAVNGFNPLLISSAFDQQAAGLLYQPLIWVTRRFHINRILSIARRITVSPGHRIFTIVLWRHWRWSDGVPVTTADVAYTYHMIQRLGPRFANYGVGGIPTDVSSFQVLGPYRLRITLKRPVNPRWFILNGLALLTPLPAAAWARVSITGLYDHLADPRFFQVVDGPFRLLTYVPGRYVTFGPNRRFAGPDKPYLHRLVMRFLHDPESIFFGLKTGKLQIADLPHELFPGRHALRGFRERTVGPVWGFNYLGFNYANPRITFVRDARVRAAMMHAIRQRLLIRVQYYGQGIRDYGPIPPQPPTYLSPLARRLERTGAYDPRLARRLLRAAGWRRGADGIREKDGHRLVFTALLSPGQIRGPTLIKDMLAKVGIDMRLREKPFNEIVAMTQGPDATKWDAIYLAWGLGVYPSARNIFACGGANNFYHYCSHRMDALLDAVPIASGKGAIYRYEDYFIKTQPLLVLPGQRHVIEARDDIHGLKRAYSSLGGFNPQYLWIARHGRTADRRPTGSGLAAGGGHP
ncbi:peptide ABC transporter substrate-binding protein [Acidiferrobacter sp.]|uniref:peptide ABC transporter substrate-binding protein n=1 Tax=Acidiferrobacter sp. TaxID=1872107 RepID=UPI00261B03D9|nr:peptide ABC transporter substrate-binding protein [Acidiferrobacter sp.]